MMEINILFGDFFFNSNINTVMCLRSLPLYIVTEVLANFTECGFLIQDVFSEKIIECFYCYEWHSFINLKNYCCMSFEGYKSLDFN